MSDTKARHAEQMRRHRANREAAGESQVVVWLPADVRSRLDEVVRSGVYKNRSEAFSAAFRQLLDETQMM